MRNKQIFFGALVFLKTFLVFLCIVGFTYACIIYASPGLAQEALSGSGKKEEVDTNVKIPDTYIYFVSELWPEEGRPRFKSKKELTLYSRPSKNAETIQDQRIPKDVMLDFTSTQYQTIKPDTLIIEEDIETEATSYSNIKYLERMAYYRSGKRLKLAIKKGQKVLILQYRAEGQYLVEIDKVVYGVDCFRNRDFNPETDWWIKINQNSIEGWVLLDKQNVDFLSRSF